MKWEGALAGTAADVLVEASIDWGVEDETAAQLLGLAKGPMEYPVSTHVYALASQMVYGLTAEFVRRAVRNVL